jgi:hypothetical protein
MPANEVSQNHFRMPPMFKSASESWLFIQEMTGNARKLCRCFWMLGLWADILEWGVWVTKIQVVVVVRNHDCMTDHLGTLCIIHFCCSFFYITTFLYFTFESVYLCGCLEFFSSCWGIKMMYSHNLWWTPQKYAEKILWTEVMIVNWERMWGCGLHQLFRLFVDQWFLCRGFW